MGLVEEWVSGCAASGRRGIASAIQLFQNWLRENGRFPSLEEAVVFQKQATDDDRYRIVDLALKFVNGVGEKYTRYGLGLHDLRDLGRSILEKAKEQKFNVTSAEFWMGHLNAVDPLFYNKIWKLDPEYNLTQYKIAERYFNILSTTQESEQIHQQEELKKMQERLANLEKVFTEKLKIK
jgi:hypothetical protein